MTRARSDVALDYNSIHQLTLEAFSDRRISKMSSGYYNMSDKRNVRCVIPKLSSGYYNKNSDKRNARCGLSYWACRDISLSNIRAYSDLSTSNMVPFNSHSGQEASIYCMNGGTITNNLPAFPASRHFREEV